MSHGWVEAIAATVSAFFALVAIGVSIVAMRRLDGLGARLAKQREDFDKKLSGTERLYLQRSALFDLWKYISELNGIDPNDPITPDIMKAVHALELVALCCEGSIVDPDLIRRTFRQTYVDLYEQIEQVTDIPGLGKNGKGLLRENRAAMTLYQVFKNEIMRRDQLEPIGE